MNNTKTYVSLLLKSSSKQQMLDNAKKISNLLSPEHFNSLEIEDYYYIPDSALEELGVDYELLSQLIEDYVDQIVKSSITFIEYLNELGSLKRELNTLDFDAFRNLSHKNLGVARNLRIEDSKKLLELMMKETDLKFLVKCVECLLARAILLKSDQAYTAIQSTQI